jgi:hypothetical protein
VSESKLTQGAEHVPNLNVEEDLIFVSVGMYRAFLAQGAVGMDAYVLFSHLCFTGKLQNTNNVWANRAYLKTGLKWAQARLDAAMSTLEKMKLVSKLRREGDKGTFGKTYIQVHRTLTPPKTNDSTKVNGDFTNDSREVRELESTKCLNESSILKQEIPEREREDPLSPSLRSEEEKPQEVAKEEGQTFRESLQVVAREVLGAETPHAVKAERLIARGEDPELVLEAWEQMLKRRPAGAAFFDKDYATRWKPSEKPVNGKCPECHVPLDRYKHLTTCSRRPQNDRLQSRATA